MLFMQMWNQNLSPNNIYTNTNIIFLQPYQFICTRALDDIIISNVLKSRKLYLLPEMLTS